MKCRLCLLSMICVVLLMKREFVHDTPLTRWLPGLLRTLDVPLTFLVFLFSQRVCVFIIMSADERYK